MIGSHARCARRTRRAGNVMVAAGVLLAAAAAALVPSLLAAPRPAASPTVQEVLARSISARGGLQKLHAAQTRRESGMLELGAGNAWPFTVEHKRPNRLRMEIVLQGTKLIRVFDGVRGWQKQPQVAAPEPLSGDDLHNIANEADFDNALVDTAAKGKAVLLGKESLPAVPGAGGREVYKVQVTLLSGDVFTYAIDAASYLPLHWEGSRMINGKAVAFESDFSDYRDAGGVKYAFQMVSSIKGSAQKQKITFNKIEIDPPIDDARFTPGTMAAPPAAPPATNAIPAPGAPSAPAAPSSAAPAPAPQPAPPPPASPPPPVSPPPAAQPPPGGSPPPSRG
jgi:hypothetical protein